MDHPAVLTLYALVTLAAGFCVAESIHHGVAPDHRAPVQQPLVPMPEVPRGRCQGARRAPSR
ncbi:hypothetical protein [Streptomyces sp. NPDC050848]|uniref:hypothetical protein n=1 Tax=Streptomyces sp. NPDC050848 TaxID=3155791 RepID=UPI0033FB2424